jgi:hypothetical protein
MDDWTPEIGRYVQFDGRNCRIESIVEDDDGDPLPVLVLKLVEPIGDEPAFIVVEIDVDLVDPILLN